MEELKSQIDNIRRSGDPVKELFQNAARKDKRSGKYERTGKKREECIHKTQYLSNWCSRKQKYSEWRGGNIQRNISQEYPRTAEDHLNSQ